jgi:predicted metal-dependent peptidase
MLWNIAGDFVINDMLNESKVGKMPNFVLHSPKYKYTMLVDDVYRDLIEENKCKECGGTGKKGDGDGDGNESGAGGGDQTDAQPDDQDGDDQTNTSHACEDGEEPCPACNGTGSGAGGRGSWDHHIYEPQTGDGDDKGEPSTAEWRRAVQSAKDAAKAMGKMPASLERFVDQLLTPKVPWEDKLRKSLAKKLGRDTTNWNRPNRRRLVTQGVIMPTYRGFGAGHIVFCVDTSGSMSDDELSQALGECDKILMDCNPERVTLIGCDARVETVTELQPGDTLQGNIPRIGGGGGTSFIPPFDYLADEGEKPETLVYFTDTGGTFPKDPPAFPVIWCCSEDWCEPPWGEVIHVEVG